MMNNFASFFFRLKKILSNLLRGISMGTADVVPGVSGGTIALVLGIYEQLLENISNCSLSLGKILKADISGSIKELKNNDRAVIQKSGTEIHPILVPSGKSEDVVSGMVFELTMDELKRADEYEVDDYERVLSRMISGAKAWIYRSSVAFP